MLRLYNIDSRWMKREYGYWWKWYWQRKAKGMLLGEKSRLHGERLPTSILPYHCLAMLYGLLHENVSEKSCLILQRRKFLPSTMTRHVLPQSRCRIFITKYFVSYPYMVILIPSCYFVNQYPQFEQIGHGTKGANACSVHVTFVDCFKYCQ
jgi:hypothetical protein